MWTFWKIHSVATTILKFDPGLGDLGDQSKDKILFARIVQFRETPKQD